jgi:C-methyltransferase./Hypothetical methyltransferase.
MDSFRRIDACRICANTELTPLLELGNQYLTGVFPRSRDERLTRGPLTLVKCTGRADACGLVQLQHSYDSSEMYGEKYGYRSSLNQSMVDHLSRKVARLSARVDLVPGDGVLDIGSNDGTTLSFYPQHLTRIGMDPTAAKFRDHYSTGVQVVEDFFSADAFETAFAGVKPKIVTSIAMFYDLDQPLEFVDQVCKVLHDQGIWHFEQSYLPSMLYTTGYDTICHEHVEYYALSQIEWMMQRSGLRIIDVELNDVNGGSFGVTVCKSAAPFPANHESIQRILAEEGRGGLRDLATFEQFADRVRQHRSDLPALLDNLTRAGNLILGYGASTKGNVMLQYCGIDEHVLPFIAEVNPDKFGAWTPGTWIPIVSEADAHAMSPDFFLAMPWHFRRNLLAHEKEFITRGGRMIFPLPSIDIAG